MAQGMATPFQAEFKDGRTVEGKTLPIDYVIAERHLHGAAERIETEMYAVMVACKRKGIDFSSLDDFLEELVDYIPLVGANASGNGAAPDGAQTSPSSRTARGSRSTN